MKTLEMQDMKYPEDTLRVYAHPSETDDELKNTLVFSATEDYEDKQFKTTLICINTEDARRLQKAIDEFLLKVNLGL